MSDNTETVRRIMRAIVDATPDPPTIGSPFRAADRGRMRTGSNFRGPLTAVGAAFAVLLVLGASLAAVVAVRSGEAPSTLLSESAASTNPTESVPPPSQGGDAPPFPLFGNLLRDHDIQIAYKQATDRRVAECMANAGFVFTPSPTVTSAPPSEAEILHRRYLPVFITDGVYGYTTPGTTSRAEDIEDEQSAEWYQAFFGETTRNVAFEPVHGQPTGGIEIGDGCWTTANADLFGSTDSYIEYLQLLSTIDVIGSLSWSQLWTDETAVAAQADWSQCMTDSGYSYTTLIEPANRDWATPRPGQEEQEIAEADHNCRVATSIETQLAGIEATIQLEFLEPYPGLLEAIAQFQTVITTDTP